MFHVATLSWFMLLQVMILCDSVWGRNTRESTIVLGKGVIKLFVNSIIRLELFLRKQQNVQITG